MNQHQGTHSNCIFKFPVFSLSDRKFSLWQFTWFVTITYTKLTWQTYPAPQKFESFRHKYWNIFTFRIRAFTTWANQIPCVLAKFPNSFFFVFYHFPCFPCAVGTLQHNVSATFLQKLLTYHKCSWWHVYILELHWPVVGSAMSTCVLFLSASFWEENCRRTSIGTSSPFIVEIDLKMNFQCH